MCRKKDYAFLVFVHGISHSRQLITYCVLIIEITQGEDYFVFHDLSDLLMICIAIWKRSCSTAFRDYLRMTFEIMSNLKKSTKWVVHKTLQSMIMAKKNQL